MKENIVFIDQENFGFEIIEKLLQPVAQIKLGDKSVERIAHCRKFLDDKLAADDTAFYGINTGFGYLYNVKIDDAELTTLQENLLKSHACGIGDEVPVEIVRLMLALKIMSLSWGHSGVQVETVERLAYFFNNNILPVVYTLGSLGASGDLAPLSHLCLPLIGLGEVRVNGVKMASGVVLEKHSLSPIRLQSKEGLALINGTQFMNAYGMHQLSRAKKLMNWANLVATLSIDAFDCTHHFLHPLIQMVRPHKGQKWVAKTINDWLVGSEIIDQPKEHVQDPYSFRCLPQVHGASKDTIDYVSSVFVNEMNAVTDNPNIFPEEDLIVSGGNFHGQPLALTLDFLSIALAELGSISERRTYHLISGARKLPPTLAKDAGLNSGFMIAQYTAASIVSENKQLCTPASVDTIPSSNNQEDHVSMGANAATKCKRVVDNLQRILAIELFTAAQAFEYRRPLKSSPIVEKLHAAFREEIPFLINDREMYKDFEIAERFLVDNYKHFFSQEVD